MQTYTFDKYVLETEYPESGARVRFGRGYEFASRPRGPDQVEYVLHYEAMFFYFLTNSTTLDLTKNTTINMALMEQFYQNHKLYEPFVFPHPSKGNLTVRFREPLKFKVVKGGRGQVEPFSVRLIQQP